MARMSPFKIISSGEVIATGNYKIGAVDITPGSTDASIALYDSTTSTASKMRCKARADSSASGDTRHFLYVPGIKCNNGIYAKLTGTNAEAWVYYYG